MDDLKKLGKLIPHWLEHNAQHVESYRDWANRMRRAGKTDLADLLDQVADGSAQLNPLFRSAGSKLEEG